MDFDSMIKSSILLCSVLPRILVTPFFFIFNISSSRYALYVRHRVRSFEASVLIRTYVQIKTGGVILWDGLLVVSLWELFYSWF